MLWVFTVCNTVHCVYYISYILSTAAIGSKCPSNGMDAPILCPTGEYQASASQTSCAPCTAGSECSDPTVAPVSCPTGTTSSANAVNCTQCQSGKYWLWILIWLRNYNISIILCYVIILIVSLKLLRSFLMSIHWIGWMVFFFLIHFT